MARPIKLVKRKILFEIAELHKDGVPISFLIRKFKLNITPPTLSKLVDYTLKFIDCEQTNQATAALLIHHSLWPEEFKFDRDVITQPNNYAYIGKMPLGKWVNRDGEQE